MKRVKELQSQGFYILEAKNAANTHLVENEKEVDQFLIFANSHFRQFVDIYDYCITPAGWHLLIRIKNSATILNTYKSIQHRRNKRASLNTVSRIISNQVRLFRLRMTRWTNKQRGRKGNASRQVYRRYILETLEEGREHIQRVRNQEVRLDQPLKKYQAPIENYQISDEDDDVCKKMSSRNNQSKGTLSKLHLECLIVGNYLVEHLEKWILATLAMHDSDHKRRVIVGG